MKRGYLKIALILFGMTSMAQALECQKEMKPIVKDQIAELLLELNQVELEGSSSVIHRVDKNKFYVKSTVVGEVCVVPLHLAKGDHDLMGMPSCFMSNGDSSVIYEVSFDLDDQKLDEQKAIFFQAPFNKRMRPAEAKLFAANFQEHYGDSTYEDAYKKGVQQATKNPLREKQINGAYVVEDKFYFFPAPFNQYLKATDALRLSNLFKTNQGDESYMRSFHDVLERKKHLHSF